MVDPISRQEALALLDTPDGQMEALLDRVESLRREVFGDTVRLCAITNAKSGRCPEHCDFCVQSVKFATDAPVYPLKDADTMVAEARMAAEAGAREFSIVTSGRRLRKDDEIAVIEEAVRRIVDEVGIEVCASIGEVSRDVLATLKDAGMVRFHHNIETAPSHHDKIVHSHSYEDELRVVREAAEIGLQVCCGGILGMGESREQRVEMAFALREIDPACVPINFLDPRPGTPLADLDELTPDDCIRIIAMFRLVLPHTHIFVCGGRERNLAHRQADMFRAGATGTMVGDYLTTSGQPAEKDREMIHSSGFEVERSR